MTPDRWEQINKLYYAALEVAEKERTSFLEQACNSDPELCSEVESLLATHKAAGGFLGKPAMEEVAKALQDDPPSLIGRQLGPYQILDSLGAGGMGEVYKAKDTRLNRTVAIKVLPRLLSERADLRQRFEREARAIASLEHPHICALHDMGQEQGIDFLVMQYLDGETLSKRLKRGPLATEEVLRYAIEITSALHEAHRKGVIHRDLKPGNIMLTETGAKLLDFGLAKQSRPPSTRVDYSGIESATESLTEKGMLLGTLEYMAPEQLEGEEADARTDLFALGMVVYEMVTGRPVFTSRVPAVVSSAGETPKLALRLDPKALPRLEGIINKLLERDPDLRYQSASEVRIDLEQLRQTIDSKDDRARSVIRRALETVLTWKRAISIGISALLFIAIPLLISPKQKERVLINLGLWPHQCLNPWWDEFYLDSRLSSRWIYPENRWSLEKGEAANENDGAVLVKGIQIGVPKNPECRSLYDFGATFKLRLEKGVKAAWAFRVQPDRERGYVFELERRNSMLFLSGYTYAGSHNVAPLDGSGSHLVPISGCCRDADAFQVKAEVKGFEFRHWITLESNELQDDREDLGVEYPVAIFKDSKSRFRYGNVGLLETEAGNETLVEYWRITPLR